MQQISSIPHTWLWPAAILLAAVLLGLLAHRGFYGLGRRFARRSGSAFDASFFRRSELPTRALLTFVIALTALGLLPLNETIRAAASHVFVLGLIASVAWLTIALIDVADDVLSAKYAIEPPSDLRARRIQTQVHVLRRIATVVIVTVTAGIMLMTFPTVRHVGAGLFASAGVAGLIAGLAARPTLANLLAGVQIALTEPIRLNDVVIIENEWGNIEEIATTYVVVRIWDKRRLLVPLSYFIEKPFQNWTRVSNELLCTAYVYADYTVPVEAVRSELRRILATTELWDGKDWSLQVTNTTDRSAELRALMSAADASKAWDLRCYVREKLVEHLQRQYPESLPLQRATIQKPAV